MIQGFRNPPGSPAAARKPRERLSRPAPRRNYAEAEKAKIDRLAGIIETAVFTDDGIVDAFLKNRHAQYEHGGDAGGGRAKSLNRLLEYPGKKADGVFDSSDGESGLMRDTVERLILDNTHAIARWLLYEPDETLCLRLDKDEIPLDQKLGTGVARLRDPETGKDKFVERDCYDAVMILVKSNGRDAFPLWNLDTAVAMKTAYPDVLSSEAKDTGRDLREILPECYAYCRCRDETRKQAWIEACAPWTPKRPSGCAEAPRTTAQVRPDPTLRNMAMAEAMARDGASPAYGYEF